MDSTQTEIHTLLNSRSETMRAKDIESTGNAH